MLMETWVSKGMPVFLSGFSLGKKKGRVQKLKGNQERNSRFNSKKKKSHQLSIFNKQSVEEVKLLNIVKDLNSREDKKKETSNNFWSCKVKRIFLHVPEVKKKKG